MSATVIIPTTGSSTLYTAIESVLNQSYPCICYVVVDGPEFKENVEQIINKFSTTSLKVCYLPVNSGKDGYYGQRIMSAFVHFVDTKYTLFLDQDCWFDKTHVESMIDCIEKNNLDWSYSLRKIYNKDGKYLFNDDCESLGKWKPVVDYHLVDNNCYCLKTNLAVSVSTVMHGGWGQDRVLFDVLHNNIPNYDCTKQYTTNYRLGGNEGSVSYNFFEQANKISNNIYNGKFPWRI